MSCHVMLHTITQGKYDEAEPLYVRALAIKEKVLGADHPDTVVCRNNLNSMRLTASRFPVSTSESCT